METRDMANEKKKDNTALKTQLAELAATAVGYDYGAIMGVVNGFNIPDALAWLVEVFGIRLPIGSSAQNATWFFYGPADYRFKVTSIVTAEFSVQFPCRTYLRENFAKVRDLLIALGFDPMESGESDDRLYQILYSKELGFTIHLAWRGSVPEDLGPNDDSPPWSNDDGDEDDE